MCGGTKREWLAITCDGVPYSLVRKLILQKQRLAVKESIKSQGWVDTEEIHVPQLRDVLADANLPHSGNKSTLLTRIKEHTYRPVIEQVLASGGFQCVGEFDSVVPLMEGLHQEFMICRLFLDVNWDVAYKGFALSQGYHEEKQLAYI